MFLADYHMHSSVSHDSRAPMQSMAEAAISRGMSQICFTEHVDIETCYQDHVDFTPDYFDRIRANLFSTYNETCKQMQDRIDIRVGIELGAINHHPETARSIYSASGLDVVIGSIHNLRDITDFIFLKYESDEQCQRLAEIYAAEYYEIAGCRACDILGHIGYIQRYMHRQGRSADMSACASQLREVFRRAVENSIAIEVNTSGMRDGTGCFFPSLDLLKLYRECGGELITAGSDSHRPEDAGAGIFEAYQLIREAGFKYVATYKKHKPQMISL